MGLLTSGNNPVSSPSFSRHYKLLLAIDYLNVCLTMSPISNIETCTGVICCCLPCLPRLFTHIYEKKNLGRFSLRRLFTRQSFSEVTSHKSGPAKEAKTRTNNSYDDLNVPCYTSSGDHSIAKSHEMSAVTTPPVASFWQREGELLGVRDSDGEMSSIVLVNANTDGSARNTTIDDESKGRE
jgi:hypothetical protein